MSVEDGQQQVDPYSDLHIGPDEVLQIIVTSDQKHLYILSKHKVLLKNFYCGIYICLNKMEATVSVFITRLS